MSSTEARWCQDCGAMMQLRKNIYGEFWGCVRWPDCSGFQSVPRTTGRRRMTTTRPRITPNLLTFDKYQLELIHHRKGTVLALAGAGSGKSTVGVEWLSNLLMFDSDMSTVLALVYGRDAGHDLRTKWCARMGLPLPPHPDEVMVTGGPRDHTTALLCERAPTIHSWAWTQIKATKKHQKLKLVGKQKAPTLYAIARDELKDSDVEPAEVVELYGATTEALVEYAPKVMVASAKAQGIILPEKVAEVLIRVRKRLEKEGLVTYPDMLRIACDYITAGGWPAGLFEPNLKWLFVDEVQDSNMARIKIIQFLASRTRGTIFCGDLRQSIYGFAGARPDVVRALAPERDWRLLPVTRRCPQAVIDLANTFCLGRPWSVGGPTLPAPGVRQGSVEKVLDDQWRKKLAQRISKQIGEHHPNLRRSGVDTVAVLGRTRRELALVECALLGARLPVRWLGEQQGPWVTAWGKAFRGYLALASGQVTTSELVGEALSRPKRGIGGGAVEAVLKETHGATDESFWNLLAIRCDPGGVLAARLFVRVLRSVPFAEQVAQITQALTTCAARGRADGELSRQALERLEIIEALSASALELGSAKEVEHATRSGELLARDAPAVILSTVHRAKGLEWLHVHGAAVDVRNYPHHKAIDLEEEERIYYVLITRARESLTLYAAGAFSSYVEREKTHEDATVAGQRAGDERLELGAP